MCIRDRFQARHAKATVPRMPFRADYAAPVHIGIDSGSTTVKMVVIDQEARILFMDYRPNLGNPVPLIREAVSYTHLDVYKRQLSALEGYLSRKLGKEI